MPKVIKPQNDERILATVRSVYDRIGREGAANPAMLGLTVGKELALELGYPPAALARIEEGALEGFVGAAPLGAIANKGDGGWALDLGCGAGVDGLLLAHKNYRVAGVDLSLAMLRRLSGAASAGEGNPGPVNALLPELPFGDEVANLTIVNGAANMVADKDRLAGELFRTLAPGGVLLVGDLMVTGEVGEVERELPEAWAWCVGGALGPDEWRRLLGQAGFGEVSTELLEEETPLARGLVRAEKSAY